MVSIDLNGEPEAEDGTVVNFTTSQPPKEGMRFDSGFEFSEFCHRYAYNEGFEMFVSSDELKKEYKDKGVSKRRSIDGATFDRIMINDKGGVSVSRNFGTQLIEKGGFDNMTFNKRDVRNAIAVERRKTMFEEGDAASLEKYFKSQRELNSDFYSSMQRDEEGILRTHSGPTRVAEELANTSGMYRMPFAPFVGVNHHGKSIVFAAALISHEDTETFVWVFEEWLKCLGKPLKGILTDQDKAIGKAISKVFPGVPHRLCLWHMLQNASRNLGKLAEWKSIDTLIRTVVHDMLDPAEFDEAWCLVMDTYNQQEEKEDNFDCIDKPPQLDVDKSVLAEYVFHKVYTNEMFADIVCERKGLTHTNVTKIDAIGSLLLYRADEKLTSPHWRKRFKSYSVKVDKVKERDKLFMSVV
ncbi:protein FAR1-RELATED SEQUENCE 5-like [Spinacia oleracea]|uniref:Protein FAR1-RELATED SEQUENCE 5-like n=1 Tax=Spinacia oleracea TaxID=3562 RepID=A0ABM3RGP8_SPIOL|nr:protein FAR1-RELATED SEQUENCE 5-like [Spinacia oleracea]